MIETLLTVALLLVPIGIITGIVLAVKARKAQGTDEKRRIRRLMWVAYLGPIALVIILVVINGIIRVAANTVQ